MSDVGATAPSIGEEERIAAWLTERVATLFPVGKERRASVMTPGDREALLLRALNAHRLGMEEVAFTLLFDLVLAHPGWEEAHVCLAQLLWQSGAREAFELFLIRRANQDGCPANVLTACLRMLNDASLYQQLKILLPAIRRRSGEHLFFTILEAVAASETGAMEQADHLFAKADQQGGRLSLPHVRHLLRRGEPDQAARLAEEFVGLNPGAQGGWALLATAWRLTGDARHHWLVEQPGLVRTVDLEIGPAQVDALAARLRTLHVARSHPFDQSLRGGTQTAGRLLRRHEPEIRQVRQLLTAAIRNHVRLLPPHDPTHPLLGQPRDSFHFSDSWSVRLIDGGRHVSHIHPMGALSSALYITLPPPVADTPHAGWLTLGVPPDELNSGLEPLLLVEPQVGRLAIFPSYLWHATLPFPQGERMTIAFDTVLRPPPLDMDSAL